MAIPKGLKVGDTFVDDGATYKVVGFVGEYYSSVRVGASSPKTPEVAEETKEEKNYESIPYGMLKKMCAERGLDAKGTKAELIERLKG